jgi:hypothetical protein
LCDYIKKHREECKDNYDKAKATESLIPITPHLELVVKHEQDVSTGLRTGGVRGTDCNEARSGSLEDVTPPQHIELCITSTSSSWRNKPSVLGLGHV